MSSFKLIMQPRQLLTLAGVIGCIGSASLSAADVNFVDLRLGGGVLSNDYKGASSITVTNNTSNVSTTTNSGEDGRDADQNYRGQLQLVWGFLGPAGGLIVGGGIAANQSRFKNGSQTTEVTTPVVDVLIGYGIAVIPEWHFELTPFAGAGRSYFSVSDSNSSNTSKDWGKYVEYGAKIGTYYTFNQSIQIGLEIPYLVGKFDPEYNSSDNTNTYTISDSRKNQGFGALLTLGARF